MPVPIRLVDDRDRGDTSPNQGYFEMNLDMLSSTIGSIPTKTAEKFVYASDEDASLLFDLWQKSAIVRDSEGVGDKRYAVPAGFSNDDILRLKASNFIAGDDTIRFLPRAVSVIKTMVLSEDNDFGKRSERKPYSVILAEIKGAASGGPRLALGSAVTASATDGDGFRFALGIDLSVKTAKIFVPLEKIPRSDTHYIRSERLIYYNDRGSDKEYVIRVYQYDDGTFATIAFNGRTGGTLQTQPKYYGDSLSVADAIFNSVQEEKINKGYERESYIYNLLSLRREYLRTTGHSAIPETQAPGRPFAEVGEEAPLSAPEPTLAPTPQTEARKPAPKSQPPKPETQQKSISDGEIKKFVDKITGQDTPIDMEVFE